MALSRWALRCKRIGAQSLSTGTLDAYLKKSKDGHLKDPFLQPIDRPALLQEFPDYTVVDKGEGQCRAKHQDRFAVVQLGAHQFKVTPHDKIFTEKIRGLAVNSKVRLGKVLVWASRDDTVVGRPFIPGAYVQALVEEQCEDAEVTIFKKKRRKNYRRTKYHTQELTGVRILRICDKEEIIKAHKATVNASSDASLTEKGTLKLQ